MDLVEILERIGPPPSFLFGGLLGGLLGSGVAIWRSRYSAKSSDLTKRVETIYLLVDELSDAAARSGTHLGTEKDLLKSSKSYCIALQARIADALRRLNSDYGRFESTEVNRAYFDFADACTGGDFDSSAAQHEALIRRILLAGGRFKDEIGRVRMRFY